MHHCRFLNQFTDVNIQPAVGMFISLSSVTLILIVLCCVCKWHQNRFKTRGTHVQCKVQKNIFVMPSTFYGSTCIMVVLVSTLLIGSTWKFAFVNCEFWCTNPYECECEYWKKNTTKWTLTTWCNPLISLQTTVSANAKLKFKHNEVVNHVQNGNFLRSDLSQIRSVTNQYFLHLHYQKFV